MYMITFNLVHDLDSEHVHVSTNQTNLNY